MTIPNYTKTTFVNGTAPGISSTELNKLGDGVEDNRGFIQTLDGEVSQLDTDLTTAEGRLNTAEGDIIDNANDISNHISNTGNPHETTLPAIKRVGSIASTGSLTIDINSYDMYIVTSLSQALTINAPTGSAVNGQALLIRIKDNGTTRALTWNAIFNSGDRVLPSDTEASQVLYVIAVYNSQETHWDVLDSYSLGV